VAYLSITLPQPFPCESHLSSIVAYTVLVLFCPPSCSHTSVRILCLSQAFKQLLEHLAKASRQSRLARLISSQSECPRLRLLLLPGIYSTSSSARASCCSPCISSKHMHAVPKMKQPQSPPPQDSHAWSKAKSLVSVPKQPNPKAPSSCPSQCATNELSTRRTTTPHQQRYVQPSLHTCTPSPPHTRAASTSDARHSNPPPSLASTASTCTLPIPRTWALSARSIPPVATYQCASTPRTLRTCFLAAGDAKSGVRTKCSSTRQGTKPRCKSCASAWMRRWGGYAGERWKKAKTSRKRTDQCGCCLIFPVGR
jgi:hypothetical protein